MTKRSKPPTLSSRPPTPFWKRGRPWDWACSFLHSPYPFFFLLDRCKHLPSKTLRVQGHRRLKMWWEHLHFFVLTTFKPHLWSTEKIFGNKESKLFQFVLPYGDYIVSLVRCTLVIYTTPSLTPAWNTQISLRYTIGLHTPPSYQWKKRRCTLPFDLRWSEAGRTWGNVWLNKQVFRWYIII